MCGVVWRDVILLVIVMCRRRAGEDECTLTRDVRAKSKEKSERPRAWSGSSCPLSLLSAACCLLPVVCGLLLPSLAGRVFWSLPLLGGMRHWLVVFPPLVQVQSSQVDFLITPPQAQALDSRQDSPLQTSVLQYCGLGLAGEVYLASLLEDVLTWSLTR